MSSLRVLWLTRMCTIMIIIIITTGDSSSQAVSDYSQHLHCCCVIKKTDSEGWDQRGGRRDWGGMREVSCSARGERWVIGLSCGKTSCRPHHHHHHHHSIPPRPPPCDRPIREQLLILPGHGRPRLVKQHANGTYQAYTHTRAHTQICTEEYGNALNSRVYTHMHT